MKIFWKSRKWVILKKLKFCKLKGYLNILKFSLFLNDKMDVILRIIKKTYRSALQKIYNF